MNPARLALILLLLTAACRHAPPTPALLSAKEREARVDALLTPLAEKLIQTTGNRTVAMTPFRKEKADFEPRVSIYILPRLRDQLVKARVTVITREDLDRVLKEHELQSSDLIDRGTAVKLGQISGAQALVAGTVRDLNPRVYRLEIKLLDLTTATILLTETVDIPRELLPIAYGGI